MLSLRVHLAFLNVNEHGNFETLQFKKNTNKLKHYITDVMIIRIGEFGIFNHFILSLIPYSYPTI